MATLLKSRLILPAVYALLFSVLFTKAMLSPQFDGGEWFAMYFLSFPVSAGVEFLRDAGYFFDGRVARALAYAIGCLVFWYVIGYAISWVFGRKKRA